jgi:hypothetical protein
VEVAQVLLHVCVRIDFRNEHGVHNDAAAGWKDLFRMGGNSLDTVTKELGREELDAGRSEEILGCKNGREMRRRKAKDSKTGGRCDRSADY